jgi:hypothetical protein
MDFRAPYVLILTACIEEWKCRASEWRMYSQKLTQELAIYFLDSKWNVPFNENIQFQFEDKSDIAYEILQEWEMM